MGDDWMQLWVNAAQMKAADQYTIQKLGVPSLELMEHAAQACVQVLEDERLIFLMSVLSVVRVIMEGTVSQLPAFYKITDTP